MKKKNYNKLVLNKLTVAVLNRQEMVFVGGGTVESIIQCTYECKPPAGTTGTTTTVTDNCRQWNTDSTPRKTCFQ